MISSLIHTTTARSLLAGPRAAIREIATLPHVTPIVATITRASSRHALAHSPPPLTGSSFSTTNRRIFRFSAPAKCIPGSAAVASRFHTSAYVRGNDTTLPSATPTKPESRPCWKCSAPVPYMAVLCTNPECKAVQTLAPGANYFEILGLSPEPSFDLDVKDLRNRFFKIQQQVHPDSYSQNTNGDQVYAQQQSSLANKAYSTLKEPLSRANYMLEVFGSPIHETESLNEPELLMEVMEARELLEDAQTEEEVEDLKHVNDGRMKEAVEGLSLAFQKQDLETAKTLAIELQYWVRIQNVIRDWAAGKPIVADHV